MSAKLSRKCFVPGCISGHQNATKASLFKVPKDEKLRRERAKRISRGDTELSIHHSVCELHFEEHFIEKFYHHIVNGEEIKIPRGKPLLKPEAIPSIFPNAPKYFNKPLPQKRKQLLAINAYNNASKRKSTQGMIYDPKWLIECIIMRMKGPKLYEHIRENKILIVPGKNCLQRYVKNYRSGFGFCDSVFQAIKVKTQSMEPYFLHGGILIDEMKLSENLHVSSDGQIEGFVDLGNFQNEKKQSNHGLVFLFQPFVGDWKQIVAVFATCNNIKGTLLADLIIEATILLENADLCVDFITCDGATWNKVMWKKCGMGTLIR
ncbi:uncharacterized protein LOC118184592 [Stegodyphus dumicola]|uniref:uncharacterized protein LOC118184592 n=1 Tax=Stegodyphus dumicola TaxID=202533 RepID=UPI0015A7D9FB|nr:uncharacterized protein LOC118184592 [Stegodyphus dumicola]